MRYKIGDELIDTDISHIEYVRIYNKGKEEKDKMLVLDEAKCFVENVTSNSVQVLINKKTNHGANGLQWMTEDNVDKRFKIKA